MNPTSKNVNQVLAQIESAERPASHSRTLAREGNNILDESSDSGDDLPSIGYNPVRHFVSALFPRKYKHKFMLMLTSYMDETGHSRDAKSTFNGMGGLLCRAEEWELFERRWDRMLKRYKIPYIHMTESHTMFKGWAKSKVEALSKEAWDKIENIKPLPIGSIIPMDDFRQAEERFRYYFEDPYFIAMQDCMKIALAPALVPSILPAFADQDIKVAIVFSDQVEFRHEALAMYEAVMNATPVELRDRIDPPDFRRMKDWGALQAADMIAYEIYKERERVYYNLARKQRYGYGRMLEIFKAHNLTPVIRCHDAQSLSDILNKADRNTLMEKYWKNKRSGQVGI